MAFSSAALQTLGNLLTNFHFYIPDYQRGYSWTRLQLEALWNDLHAAANSNGGQHFTGIVLLKQLDKDSDRLPVELVDGQQRVISTITLACALMRRIAQDSAEPITPADFRLTFTDGQEQQAYFDVFSLGRQDQASRLDQECSSYSANLKAAGAYYSDRASELADAAMARRYLDTLLQRFSLFVLDVQPEFDIHVAFETLNNRGKKLSHLELLKNRLIYLTNLLPAQSGIGAEALRQDIHAAWKGIYRSLGRSPATQNHDDEFLRAHSIAYFGEEKEADWLAKVLLDRTFNASNQSLDLAFIKAYIGHLEQAARWWSHIHDSKSMPKTHQLQLHRVGRVGHAYFKTLILAAYMRACGQHSAALAHPAEHETQLAPVLPLLVQIERFVVLIFTLSGRPAHLGRSYMNQLATGVTNARPGTADKWTTGVGLADMTASAALEYAMSYVRSYMDNHEDGDSCTDPRFEVRQFSEADVVQAVAHRARRDGYYNWDFTRVLLLEYEESLRNEGNKPVALQWPWDKFSFDRTVEHVYPQNPKPADWDVDIKIDGRNEGLKRAVVHSLGNLMLLATSVNSSLSTLPFRIATDRCKQKVYARGSYSETQVAQVFDSWNVAAIAARGVAMLKFAERRWAFNLTDDADDYASYLPILFGEKSSDVRAGKASRDRKLDNRALNPLVAKLLR